MFFCYFYCSILVMWRDYCKIRMYGHLFVCLFVFITLLYSAFFAPNSPESICQSLLVLLSTASSWDLFEVQFLQPPLSQTRFSKRGPGIPQVSLIVFQWALDADAAMLHISPLLIGLRAKHDVNRERTIHRINENEFEAGWLYCEWKCRLWWLQPGRK